MGVVNVTPDSFSDGGEWFDSAAALRHGYALLAEGADIIDVGGESTRPGAERPSVAEERRRVLPVVQTLAAAGAVVSIDTMRAEVAADAIEAGARVVNDVSGGRSDPEILTLVAQHAIPYVCMHWRGHSADMQSRATYADVVADVVAELDEQLGRAEAAGVDPDLVVIDPGFGFAKTGEHNWELLRRLEELEGLGRPLLLGLSRKAFLGSLLAGPDGTPRPAKAARRRHHGTDDLVGIARRLGRPGARRTRQPGRDRRRSAPLALAHINRGAQHCSSVGTLAEVR